jgi:cell fate (sporulation/competence/biofilm development) regulator YmcA (YheA/YmcA/DUF963 family)
MDPAWTAPNFHRYKFEALAYRGESYVLRNWLPSIQVAHLLRAIEAEQQSVFVKATREDNDNSEDYDDSDLITDTTFQIPHLKARMQEPVVWNHARNTNGVAYLLRSIAQWVDTQINYVADAEAKEYWSTSNHIAVHRLCGGQIIRMHRVHTDKLERSVFVGSGCGTHLLST